MQDSNEGFVRGLRLVDAVTLVIGTMVGSGIFIVSADIARIVKSPGLLLVVWLIAGLLTVIAALTYAELAAALPNAGGQYVFLREAYGKLLAFLYGWSFFLVISTGIVAAISIGFAKFLGIFIPSVSTTNTVISLGFVKVSTEQLVAMLVITVLTYVNCRGVREGAFVQNVFTFLKVLAVIILLIAGLTVGKNPSAITVNFSNLFAGSPRGFDILTTLGAAMVGALFSLDAWAYVCFAAAEVKNPRKNLPRALLLGTGVVALLYIIVNISYMYVLPLVGNPEGTTILTRGIQYAAEDRVATAVAKTMLGNMGLYIVAAAIIISTFGCVNGTILTSARMYYAMAKDGLFFKSISYINSTTHVPVIALVVGGIWSCILTLSGSYGQLLDYTIFTTLLFYVLTIIGIFILRIKQPNLDRPYKAWGYPWLPIVYIILASLILIDLLIYKPTYTWPGLIIVLTGIPVYYIWRWRSSRV